MNALIAKMREVGAGCILCDRAHSAELLHLVMEFGEEWAHWAELFLEHDGVAFLLIFFDENGQHPFEEPFALFVGSHKGLGAAIDLALSEMSNQSSRWALLADEHIRTEVNAFLSAHSESISKPYRWDEQTRLH